jgi:DNA-directed RNA polymerase specialized sigma24 family protein
MEDNDLAALSSESDEEQRLHQALSLLSLKQQKLVKAIYFEGVSVSEYAACEGVDHSAISHRLETIKRKLIKLSENPHI